MLDIEPLLTRIIAKRDEVKKVGSIYIPETATSMKATEGEVLAIGNEVTAVQPGDRIYWGLYSAKEIERNGENYSLMNEEDVLGIIRKGK